MVAIADQATQPAEAASFTVTPAQLQINQRISQAAVRRSNEALDLLDPVRKSGAQDDAPGWGTAQIRDGAITAAKLDTAARERLPRWAVVAATTGSLVRGQGAASAAKATDTGHLHGHVRPRRERLLHPGDARATGGRRPITTDAVVTAWRSATDAKVVTVRTADGTNTVQNTIPFSGLRALLAVLIEG